MKWLCVLMAGIALTGCNSPQDCASNDTSTVLNHLIQTKVIDPANAFRKQFAETGIGLAGNNDPQAIKLKAQFSTPLSFNVTDIVTTEKSDHKTTCKATIHLSDGSYNEPFTFTVEETTEGKLLVTAYGL